MCGCHCGPRASVHSGRRAEPVLIQERGHGLRIKSAMTHTRVMSSYTSRELSSQNSRVTSNRHPAMARCFMSVLSESSQHVTDDLYTLAGTQDTTTTFAEHEALKTILRAGNSQFAIQAVCHVTTRRAPYPTFPVFTASIGSLDSLGAWATEGTSGAN